MEDLDKTRKRLIYRSWHRGTREMDLIMGRFADAHVPAMEADDLRGYDELLSMQDPDIYDWLIGLRDAPCMLPPSLHKLFAENRTASGL